MTFVDKLAQEIAQEGEFSRAITLPAIPTVGQDLASMARVVEALKKRMEVREGLGSQLDRAVTLRDLLDAGAIQLNVAGRVIGGTKSEALSFAGAGTPGPKGDPGEQGEPGAPGGGFADPRPILETPPALGDFRVTGGFNSVFVDWTMIEYQNHRYVEVYRATTNSRGAAVFIGTTTTNFYNDTTAALGQLYFYWARAVGIKADGTTIYGPDNAVSGTSGGRLFVNGVDLAPLLIDASKLADGSVSASKLADQAVTSIKFATGIEPVTLHTGGSLPTVKSTNALYWNGKLYRWNGSAYTASVPTSDLAGTIGNALITDIAAGKITGQLTDSQIESILAAKISGQITTTQITDNAITSPKILAGAVVAGKLAANSVLAENLTADSVVAGKIAAAAINAREIAAGAIVASKIVVTDTSNVYPDYNMVDDAFYSTSTLASYFFATTGFQSAGTRRLVISPDSVLERVESSWFAVEASTDYRVEVLALRENGTSGTARVIAQEGSLSNAGVITPGAETQIASVSVIDSTTRSGANVVTSSTTRRMRLIFERAAGGDGQVTFGGPMIRRRSNGNLIVDGSIVAEKLAAASVVAGKIAANAVAASNIIAGTITGDRLAAGTITADRIQAGTITGDRIAASTITGGNIVGLTITGDKIAANTVTAAKIDSRGLSIQDALGNVILSAGTQLAPQYASNALRNDQITVSSGVLTGIGTAGVTVDNSYQTIGQNLLPNSDQTQKATWSRGGVPNGATFVTPTPVHSTEYWPDGQPGSAIYVLRAGQTRSVAINQNNRHTGTTDNDTDGQGNNVSADFNFAIDAVTGLSTNSPTAAGVACLPGERVIGSVYLGAHRCGARVYMTFHGVDASGNFTVLGYAGFTDGSSIYFNAGGGDFARLDQFTRVRAIGVAPAGTTRVTLTVRKYNTTAGNTDSWLWIAAPQIEKASANQSGPGPYMPGPVSSNLQLGYTGDQDAQRNSRIQIVSGAIQGIGTGAGTTVDNSQIGINASGQFYGGGAGTGVTVSNAQMSMTSDGRLLNAGAQQGQATLPGMGLSHWRAVAVGQSGTNLPAAAGLYKDGATVSGVNSTYVLNVINRSTGQIVFTGSYDVRNNGASTSGQGASSLAAALNATGSDAVVVVRSHNDARNNRLTGGLEAAMYRCGASRAVFGSSQVREYSAYILVGIPGCGEGNGAEVYQGAVDNDPNAWVDLSFYLQNGALTGVSTTRTPTTLADYGYTGDLNATRGAPAGTLVGGTDASTVASNAANGASAFTAVNNPTTGLAAKLNSAGGTITGRVTLAVADGVFAGTDLNNGVYMGSTGIIGKKAGVTNFALTQAGDLTVRGDITGSTGTFAGSVNVGTGVGGYISVGNATYLTGTGMWAGIDTDGIAKWRVGSTGTYVRWTGADLEFKYEGPQPNLGVVDQFHSVISPQNAYLNYTLNPDGTAAYTVGVNTTALPNWFSPGIAGAGNGYEVRFDLIGQNSPGPGATGPFGQWLSLSSARGVTLQDTTDGFSFRFLSVDVTIRRTSNQQIVSEGRVYFETAIEV